MAKLAFHNKKYNLRMNELEHPSTSIQKPWFSYACLALSMALVGSYVALSKPLVLALPIFLLAWLRFGIAAIAMLPWLRKPAGEAVMDRKTKQLLFWESFLGNFLFSICMLFGVSMTSAVSAGIILATIPAVVALMSWFFLQERISPRVWLAILCAVAGIALLTWYKGDQQAVQAGGQNQLLGNILVFGSVLCEAAYAVIGKSLSQVLAPKRISALINLWGLALMTPMGVYVAWHFDFSGPDTSIWILLLLYALAASIWTVWLWMTGLKHVSASKAGVFTAMLPISAMLIGVFVLGERFYPAQLAALALVLIGLVLASSESA